MNHVLIIGNLTKDPETRTSQAGKAYTSFTVAVDRRGIEGTDYFRTMAWGPLGESCSRYLSKGKKVAVTGSVSLSQYTAKDGSARASMDVIAQNVEFLSPREIAPETPQKPTNKAVSKGFVEVDEPLPF